MLSFPKYLALVFASSTQDAMLFSYGSFLASACFSPLADTSLGTAIADGHRRPLESTCMRGWVSRLFKQFQKSHTPIPNAHQQRRASFRPMVELLEGRLTPANFTITSLADSGAGTLREAITASVTNGAGNDLIQFSA